MKPISTLLFSLLFCALTAQVQHQAEHYGFEKSGNSVVIGNTCYYLTRSWRIDAYCSDSVFLVAKSVSGQSLFRKYVMAMPHIEELKLVRAGNELVSYCNSEMRGCDYDLAESYFKGFDLAGNTLWSFKNFASVIAVVGSSTGTWRYFSPTHVYSYMQGGLLYDSRTHGLTVIYAAGPISGSGYMINYGNMTGSRLRIANDTSLAILDAAVTTTFAILEQSSVGNFYGMNTGTIQKFDSGLNAVAMHSANGTSFRTFSCAGDSIVIAGMSNTVQPFYALLNTSLTPVFTSTSNIEKYYPTGIALKSNTVVMTGFMQSSTGFGTKGDYSAFLSLPLGVHVTGAKDIGIVSVNYTQSYFAMPTTFGPYLWICNANVVLQNVGNDTIREFYLNHLSLTGGIGYQNLGLNRKYKAKIAPQGSITVATATFSPYRTFSNPGVGTFSQFCLHVSVPDSALDIDLSNNTSCSNAQAGFVGLKDIEISSQVIVYPNPVESVLQIQTDKKISQLKVYDCSGRLVFEKNTESSENTVDVSDLEKGIYFLELEIEGRVVAGKFSK
jgi:hypothetical protein